MAVRIGKIELTGLQRIKVDDTRNLVQLRGPGQKGASHQDLGREPVRILLEGLLLGSTCDDALESLREAYQKASPLSFAADAVKGTEVTQVIIEKFDSHQLAGYENQYTFLLKVKEYIKPPSPGFDLLGCLKGIMADLDKWKKLAALAMKALKDPMGAFKDLLADPALLSLLSVDELVKMVEDVLDQVTGGQLADLFQTLARLDPEKLVAFVEKLSKAGSLEDVLNILAKDGIDLLETLTGVDMSDVRDGVDTVKALVNSAELWSRLKKLIESASRLGSSLKDFDPQAVVKPLTELGKL